jgi:hypothetical protein
MRLVRVIVLSAIATIFTTTAFASVLMEEWTEGTKRYCKYSDGAVIEISATENCPRYN